MHGGVVFIVLASQQEEKIRWDSPLFVPQWGDSSVKAAALQIEIKMGGICKGQREKMRKKIRWVTYLQKIWSNL